MDTFHRITFRRNRQQIETSSWTAKDHDRSSLSLSFSLSPLVRRLILEKRGNDAELADYEGPLREEDPRGSVPRCVWPDLLSRGVFSVKSNRRGKIFRRFGFVEGVRLQKGQKRRRDRAFCAKRRLCPAGPHAGRNGESSDRVSCRSTERLGCALSVSCRFFRFLVSFSQSASTVFLSARTSKLGFGRFSRR